MKKNEQSRIWITLIFIVVQIAVMAVLAYRGQGDYFRSIMITTCAWLGYTFWEVKCRFVLSAYIRLLMTLTIFFDAFFGYVFNLYEISGTFDKLLHVFGTYSFSLFAYVMVMRLQKKPIRRAVKFILVLCLGLSLGAFYEILEFIGDHVSQPQPPNQPSLLDTDFDLVGDFIGSILAAGHTVHHDFADKEGLDGSQDKKQRTPD